MSHGRSAGRETLRQVILDTSVLINFLAVDRFVLLASHPEYRFAATNHVRHELSDGYPEEVSRLAAAVQDGQLEEISVSHPAELAMFATLMKDGVLGAGECSAIAAASNRGAPLGIDDRQARKRAGKHCPGIVLLGTHDLMVDLIKLGVLDIAGADAIKSEWEAVHSFRMKFASFREIV